ncbi:hypothetical protein Scep_000587 [Stephania cephalantha]|uniref:Uncharacterized protein n=1 Tax=Stephania cephalantha TaxID=152367 RepID=A0AAP0L6L5_9MAGN
MVQMGPGREACLKTKPYGHFGLVPHWQQRAVLEVTRSSHGEKQGSNEVAERLAFCAIAVNLAPYLILEMHESLPDAATHVTDWIGTAYVLTLLGAFFADAYLGRFKTMISFSCIFATGMVLLTASASKDCEAATQEQKAYLFGGLALIALGTGGIKPCGSSFGADQFDEADEKEVYKKCSFFNWFFFGINMGALPGITLLAYVRLEKGWGWGFGVPTGAIVCWIVVLGSGMKLYRHQKPRRSPFTRFAQVGVASVRNHLKGVKIATYENLYEVRTKESGIIGARKLPHTKQYSKAKQAAQLSLQS